MSSFAHILTASDEFHEVFLRFLHSQQVRKMVDAIQAEDNLAGFSEDSGDDDSFYGFDIPGTNSLDDSNIDISETVSKIDESAEEATSKVSVDD